jgi:hypothetical protein
MEQLVRRDDPGLPGGMTPSNDVSRNARAMLPRSSDRPSLSMRSSTSEAERKLGKLIGLDPNRLREKPEKFCH